MIEDVKAGKIGTIIVKDMSRLGRNYIMVGFYTEIMFKQEGVRFIAVTNSVDSDKPQENDFTPFLNIMNEYYAKDTSKKIKSIFDAKMRSGYKVSASVPYGYTASPEDKRKLIIDPESAKVVTRIFTMITEEKTTGDIERISFCNPSRFLFSCALVIAWTNSCPRA